LVRWRVDGRPAPGRRPAGAAAEPQAAQDWHLLAASEAISVLGSDPRHGLARGEAAARLARHGPNRLGVGGGRSALETLIDQFLSLPVAMLLGSALISVFTGGAGDALVILAVVGINAAIGFFTERQAERTIRGLQDLTPKDCRVIRDGQRRSLPAEHLVPGDIVLLAPGSFVAADLRLLTTRELSVDESALTGESLPVEKDAHAAVAPDAPLAERANLAFMGTAVTGGSAHGLVVGTGAGTEIGRIQALLGEVRAPDTPMETQLARLGARLAVLSGLVCGGVFVLGVLRGQPWLEMLESAVSLAVAAVPEGLPTVATTTLALGIAEMRRHQVAVRHLDAVETLGAIQVLCLDKTGTLTQNRMAVERLVVAGELPAASASGGGRPGIGPSGGERDSQRRRLLEVVALCNEVETRRDGPPRGSATERALVELAARQGIDIGRLHDAWPRLELHQRAEGRALMSSFHGRDDGALLIAAKGSPAELLDRCASLGHPETPLDDAARELILRENDRMAADALRVLGVAYREVPPGQLQDQVLHTRDLTWLGLVGLSDPLRPGMAELMGDFHRAGIKTVMITGDQSATATAVGRALDLSARGDVRVLDSSDLGRLDPGMLRGLVPDTDVFARVSPAHKLRIVRAFQQAGRVVAMTGDGINDGPALKAADTGVAMGQAGSDLARSVAAIVLEDDNLHTMRVAVAQGRTIYANIQKTVHFLLSTNFSEIEVMTLAVALGLGAPLNPMQLLWINLMTDIFPGLALAMEAPEAGVMGRPPRDPRAPIVAPDRLVQMARESAVITAGTLGAFLYGLRVDGSLASGSTLAFNTLTGAQLLHALNCRTAVRRAPGDPGLPRNPQLEWALGASLAVQVLANLAPPLRRLLGLAPVGVGDLLVTAAGAVIPLAVNRALKPRGNPGAESEHSP
jgi:Ca2+-transporting ATPase